MVTSLEHPPRQLSNECGSVPIGAVVAELWPSLSLLYPAYFDFRACWVGILPNTAPIRIIEVAFERPYSQLAADVSRVPRGGVVVVLSLSHSSRGMSIQATRDSHVVMSSLIKSSRCGYRWKGLCETFRTVLLTTRDVANSSCWMVLKRSCQ